MFGIFADAMMTATRHERAVQPRDRWAAPKTWLEDDLPFRRFAGTRTGRND